MSDAEISIGAKDTASKALKNVAGASDHLSRRMSILGGSAKSLQSAFAPLLAIFAAVKGIQAFAGMISDSNEAFLTQEKAARGATDAQLEYATQMQRVLGVGDEVSLQLMKQAELLGISKEQTDEAATAAIGLAKATGQGQAEALKKVTQAMNGNANALAEVIPGITEMATEQEKLAAINELATRGLQEQKEQMSGLEGIQQRATNSWGDMLEVIGEILAPIRAVISQGFAVFAEVMQDVLQPALVLAREAMEALPAVLEWVSGAVIGAVTVIEVVITNLPAIFEAMRARVELIWLGLAGTIEHTLTVVLPGYLNWFGDNWTTMLLDIFRLGVTIVQNYVQNYADILIRLWEFVSSGFRGGAVELFTDVADIATRSLIDGFEAKTKSLPDIVDRQLSEREQSLQDKIGKIGADLGNQFANKFNDRMAAVGETFKDFSTQANLTANEAAGTLGKAAKEAGTLTAAESRLQTRGRSDDPATLIADNTKATVRELQALNRRQEQQKPQQTQQIVLGVASA